MNGKNKTADIVIVGSGLSGLAAAITAAEGGAKAVVFDWVKQQHSHGKAAI